MRRTLGSPPVIALTATVTPAVRDDIARVCGLRTPVRVVAGFDRPNLRYVVHRVSRAADRDHQIQQRVPVRDGASIIYAASRARASRESRPRWHGSVFPQRPTMPVRPLNFAESRKSGSWPA